MEWEIHTEKILQFLRIFRFSQSLILLDLVSLCHQCTPFFIERTEVGKHFENWYSLVLLSGDGKTQTRSNQPATSRDCPAKAQGTYLYEASFIRLLNGGLGVGTARWILWKRFIISLARQVEITKKKDHHSIPVQSLTFSTTVPRDKLLSLKQVTKERKLLTRNTVKIY